MASYNDLKTDNRLYQDIPRYTDEGIEDLSKRYLILLKMALEQNGDRIFKKYLGRGIIPKADAGWKEAGDTIDQVNGVTELINRKSMQLLYEKLESTSRDDGESMTALKKNCTKNVNKQEKCLSLIGSF